MGKILKNIALLALIAFVVWSLFNADIVLPYVMVSMPVLFLSLIVLAPVVLLIYIICKLVGSSTGRVILIVLVIGIAIFIINIRKSVLESFDFINTVPAPASTYQNQIPADTISVDESFFEN